MAEHRESPSSGEVATAVANASVGLGILTMTLFPLSLGGLLLLVIAPLALVIAPFVLIPLLAALVAAPFILLFRLVRTLMARRPAGGRARRGRATGGTLTAREVAARRCS